MIAEILIVLGTVAMYIGYMAYSIPIPRGMSEPLKLRIGLVQGAVFFRIAGFLDYLGLAQDYRVVRWFRKSTSPPVQGIDMVNTTMDGVRVRVYKPKRPSKKGNKAMVFYHGGGWVLCDLDSHHGITAYFAREADMVVVSVDYRLAPEHTKNDGLDDCIKVTKHFIENAAKYDVDPARVAVAGDSAGGNYAAAVALYLRDDKFSPMPKLQVLIYPCVQGIDFELPSFQQNAAGPLLSKGSIDWFQTYTTARSKKYISYFRTITHVPVDVRVTMAKGVLSHDLLPAELKYPPYRAPNLQHGGSEIWAEISKNYMDAYYFPLMAKDHSRLPETYMFTAQFDPLRDEGYLYAYKLRQDGVKVTHYNCPHGWHGMASAVSKLHDGTVIMKKMVDFINEKL